MSFVEVIFGVILAVFSAGNHGSVSEADNARLRAVSEDIWMAASTTQVVPFRGSAAREAAAIALTAVAYHESGFRADVQDCRLCVQGGTWCDAGRSVTLFQLRQGSSAWGDYSREELCQDNGAASVRAIVMLSRYRGAESVQAVFDGYARGGIGVKHTQAALDMAAIFNRFADKAGLRINGSSASWQPGKNPAVAALALNP